MSEWAITPLGANPKHERRKHRATQALMRHATASLTMDKYVQAVTPAKREAQSRIVKMLPFPDVPTRLTDAAATV